MATRETLQNILSRRGEAFWSCLCDTFFCDQPFRVCECVPVLEEVAPELQGRTQKYLLEVCGFLLKHFSRVSKDLVGYGSGRYCLPSCADEG